MRAPKVLILGGGYAGLMAASRLARHPVAQITLIDQSPHFEQRIRLHQVLCGQPVARGNLSQWLAPANVAFVEATVQDINPAQRRVRTSVGEHAYDYLIFSLGSQIAQHRIDGALEHAHALRSQQYCQSMAVQMAELALKRGHVLLVGGGLTHIETAAELAEAHPDLRITLMTRADPFASFAPEAERYFRQYLQKVGIQLLEGCTVHALHAGVCDSSHGRLTFDLCFCAPGFVASPLLQCLGEPIQGNGGLQVMPTLQLPEDDRILIAGDSAACPWPGPTPLRMGCAVALPMGAQAGENVAALIKGKAPSAFSFGFVMRCVSLGRKQGVVQATQWDDTAGTRVFTGATGAWIKERICRMTFNVPRWELQSGWRLYRWPAAPALQAASVMNAGDMVKD